MNSSRQFFLQSAIALFFICLSTAGVSAQATITVDTTAQGVTNGHCSIQEAIYATEFQASLAISQTAPDTTYNTACVAGTGKGDTIVLPANLIFNFDHFWDGDAHNIAGPTATPLIFSNITIEGNGSTLQWTGTGNSRLFAIASIDDPDFPQGTGSLTLRNVYIKGFHIKGGDGGNDGGGGGMGAGGAIYVLTGFLTVENSTFDSNGAVGGNGGADASDGGGGGGGGMFGNGGSGQIDSGGGGGGSRGDGGMGGGCGPACVASGGGGGGGGTVFAGGNGGEGKTGIGGSSGYRCGGNGGDAGNDGHEPTCPGAGGGGGGGINSSECGFGLCRGNGAQGSYGGGGGGGSHAGADGGHGGFGGGGGAGAGFPVASVNGGDGGFGGGGGAAGDSTCDVCSDNPGKGGPFGGHADNHNGGGGGALGGAIFNQNGTVKVKNSTFYNNFVSRGAAGGGSAANGGDSGGAIFSLDNTLEITNSTFSNNQATGAGGAVVVYTDEGDAGVTGGGGPPVNFNLYNTIIVNNGANECFFTGSMNVQGAGNLITHNGNGAGPFSPCPEVVSTNDPQLQSLQLNSPGNTPTMAILTSSSAANAADSSTSLGTDQRGVTRPQNGGYDIGAYEARSPDFSFSTVTSIAADVGGSGSTTVTVNSIEYFNSAVTLNVQDEPAGVAVTLSANPVTPDFNSSASSTLNATLPASLPAGSYGLLISGVSSSPSLSHSTGTKIVVTPTTGGMKNVINSFLTTGAIDRSGIANALSSKLTAAQTFITAGDNQTATNVLQAILNQLNAQSGKHINASAASALITDTQALQLSLGALRPNPLIGYVTNSNSGAITGATVNVLNASNGVVASAVTDSTGLYFFPLTRAFSLGSGYSVKTVLPKGYKKSTPATGTFTWQGSQINFSNFMLN
jgi:hypothetical protein